MSSCSNNEFSRENGCATWGGMCDVPHRSKAEICFQGQVGGPLTQDLKCQDTHVAGKAITSSRNAWIWTLQPMFELPAKPPHVPRTPAGSLEHPNPGTKQFKEDREFKSLSCFCSATKLQACPWDNFPIGFPTWLLVLNGRQRNHFIVLSASKNLGDSILEPWVVRLEEQRKSNIIWLIFSLKSLLWL